MASKDSAQKTKSQIKSRLDTKKKQELDKDKTKDFFENSTSGKERSKISASEPYNVYQNPAHDSPQHSILSDSISSTINTDSHSNLTSAKSQTDTSSMANSSEATADGSAKLPKLNMPMRNQYKKLESISGTDQLSQTCSNSSFKHEWYLQNSPQSNIESTSVSCTLRDQSYSQLSSAVSQTLTPTPLHPLPHSSVDLSSSNHIVSPVSPLSNSIPCSPPLSPITPLTNTITPDNPGPKQAHSKKSIDRVANASQYIFVAAHQISEAQEHEKRNELAEAVAKYREGVGTLLEGVQGMVSKNGHMSSYMTCHI